MKVLVLADDVSNQTNFKEIYQNNPFEAVFLLGDLEESAVKKLLALQLPVFGVYGNHCSTNYLEDLNFNNAHLKAFKYKLITIGGCEGSHRYQERVLRHRFTQEEFKQMLSDFPKVDIFLSHAPPAGVNDEPESRSHQGIVAHRDYLLKHKPRLWFHGHTYPLDNHISRLDKTIIVYTYGYKVYDLNDILRMDEIPEAKSYSRVPETEYFFKRDKKPKNQS